MARTQKRIILILFLITTIYFTLFYFPNSVGSKNINMVAVFQPDEAVPLRYVFNMIKPVDTVKQALVNFAFYGYYFYGFPYFAFSALAILPVKLFSSLNNIPLVMLILRQVISVLPMLVSVWFLVFLQTRFRSYKSIVLFIFLLSIPALVQNNFWWHPDSLAILFSVLTIFFLDLDNLRFGRNFIFAAAMSGFSAGIKGIGFYFFITIFVYLLLGFFTKKISLKRTLLSAFGYLFIMSAAYLVANPILIYTSIRERYFFVMSNQSLLLTQGYDLFYPKSISTVLPLIQNYYGNIIFIITVIFICILGIIRKKNRLLQIIILTWAIPLTVMVLGVIHFKFQYWLPVALPLFSTISVMFPESINIRDLTTRLKEKRWFENIIQAMIILTIIVQAAFFIKSDIVRYNQRLHREETNPSIVFYNQARKALKPLPDNQTYYIYHDVRIYFPNPRGWKSESIFEMLDYDYIQNKNFDIIMIEKQRILDYTKKSANPIDPQKYALALTLYSDAKKGQLKGYHMVFRNDFGLIFLRNDLFERDFIPKP